MNLEEMSTEYIKTDQGNDKSPAEADRVKNDGYQRVDEGIDDNRCDDPFQSELLVVY